MGYKAWLINLIVLFALAVGAWIGFVYFKPSFFDKALNNPHSHAEHAEGFEKGPHGGRLLQADDFQAEVTIYEPAGMTPKFRIYFYDNGVPLKPAEVMYSMKLKRINRTQNIQFKPVADYLESKGDAEEPHSFKVKIVATFKGKTHEWEYESYEGRVELSPEAIKDNSIKIETAGTQVFEIRLNVMGKIVPNEESTVHISARYPGVVKSVEKKLGDHVQKGETLAVIESNESLQNYEVKSEVDGMVIKRDINLGMSLSGQENIFVVSDLSTVWGDFNVYRNDLSQINIGDPIEVNDLSGKLKQQATISYISPLGHENTQSVIARAVLTNPEERWKPGLFISGDIIVDKIIVPVAVKDSALQTFRDWDIVFLSAGNIFEVVPVQLGRRSKEWVEVISGLLSGDNYVSENSFILKADIEKSGAKHEH